jgi:pimeloyl-ACP methyl ester carboxylesterase
LFATLERNDMSVLSQLVQRMFARPGAPHPLTALMDGAAGVSPARAARIRRESEAAVLGNAMNFPFPEIGDALGFVDHGESYRAGFRSSVPALFITGALDGNTPPDQAEEVRRLFAESTHLVIPNAGHSTPFQVEGVTEVIASFLDGGDVSERRLVADPVRLSPPFR